MNYEKIYNKLVESRKERILFDGENYEKHHIIPKSLGGDDSKENVVFLTYKEHFLAHKLLFEFKRGGDKIKMGYALHKMCTINNKNQTYRIKCGKEYEQIKKEIYDYICGENHPSFGKKMWDVGERKKISERMKAHKNHRYNKKPWNYGLTKETSIILKRNGEKHSEKFRTGNINTKNMGEKTKSGLIKISETHKNKPKSEEHKRKLSEVNKGKKMSLETKIKMSLSRKGKKQKTLVCPHCNKSGGTAMYRWHFNNCKSK